MNFINSIADLSTAFGEGEALKNVALIKDQTDRIDPQLDEQAFI
jgi:ABC-type maltose transport system permease subunit